MTAKIETLHLNMRPSSAGMLKKSKNLRPNRRAEREFVSRARFQIHSREVALKTKIGLRLLPFLLLLIPVSASSQANPGRLVSGKLTIPINAGWQFRQAGKDRGMRPQFPDVSILICWRTN